MNALSAAALATTCALLGGCAATGDHVVFVTKTSLGVEVTAQPSGASLGYDRLEGYVGPRFDNGAVPPVAASFETNGELLGRQIRQVYATGEAARIVTRAEGQAPAEPGLTGEHRPMLFSTGTTVGVKIGFGSAAATDVFTLGYKRREISVIPITEGQFPAVIAALQNDVTATRASDTSFGVGQYFATGAAARAVASKPNIQDLFMQRATKIIGAQSLHALASLACLARVPDSELPLVWRHARRTGLFKGDLDDAGFDQRIANAEPAKARAAYATYVALIDAESDERTNKLESHRTFVCGLAPAIP